MMVEQHNIEDSESEDTDTFEPLVPDVSTSPVPSKYVLIGETCHIEGEISNCNTIEVAGSLEGDFDTEELIVLDGGKVKGKVKTQYAEVHGEVVGELLVEKLLNILQSGLVYGATRYGSLAVAEGGRLIGNLGHRATPSRGAPTRKRRAAVIRKDMSNLPVPAPGMVGGRAKRKRYSPFLSPE